MPLCPLLATGPIAVAIAMLGGRRDSNRVEVPTSRLPRWQAGGSESSPCAQAARGLRDPGFLKDLDVFPIPKTSIKDGRMSEEIRRRLPIISTVLVTISPDRVLHIAEARAVLFDVVPSCQGLSLPGQVKLTPF